jgi:hypothetical protein
VEVFVLNHELLDHRQDALARVRQLCKDAAEVLQSLQNVNKQVVTVQVPDLPSSAAWTLETGFPDLSDDNIAPFDDRTDEFMEESSQVLLQIRNAGR